MRLAVDSRSSTKRQSIMFDESGAQPKKVKYIVFIIISHLNNCVSIYLALLAAVQCHLNMNIIFITIESLSLTSNFNEKKKKSIYLLFDTHNMRSEKHQNKSNSMVCSFLACLF